MRAYEACSLISFDGAHYRRDIAENVAKEAG
jgi:phosphoribosylamine-glycine ligase